MKAAYKWILNSHITAYIASEEEGEAYNKVPFYYDSSESGGTRHYYDYNDQEILSYTPINEEGIALSLNELTFEDYAENFDNLNHLLDLNGLERISGSASTYYITDDIFCKKSVYGISFDKINASAITFSQEAEPSVTATTEGVASVQKITLDFNLVRGPQGAQGDYRRVTKAVSIVSDDDFGQEVIANLNEKGEYELTFHQKSGPQGATGPQGNQGAAGPRGADMNVSITGHTGSEIGAQSSVSIENRKYNVDFSFKRGPQGDKGEDATDADATITTTQYNNSIEHEEKIYVTDDEQYDIPRALYFGNLLVYPG